ncbi:MAG: DNA-directed DNA polymerase [archaeon]|nr:DNA-directed DNA polymerase [archaeon]
MKTNFIPVDYDYFDFKDKNYIQLIGRNEKGNRVCVVDTYQPNFWVILKKGFEKDAKKVAEKIDKIEVNKLSRTTKVLKTKIVEKKFLEKDVTAIQVFVTNHKDTHDVASAIGDMKEIEARREYDIPIITKYIKENKVEPLNWYEVEGELIDIDEFGGIAGALDVEHCIKAQTIKPTKGKEFIPRVLAYDIETDGRDFGKGSLLAVSLYGENFKKVLTWKKCTGAPDYVEFFKTEEEVIEKFVEYIHQYDTDILTGYFSDGFDLPYLKAATLKNKTDFPLGLDRKGPTFTRGRIPSGKITGIVHIDLYRFISAVFAQYLQSETLSLREVAKELVGEEKEEFDWTKLENMKNQDWKALFSYNLQDSKVTYKLAQKIWPDILEFTKIIKEPMFDVTRSRMASHVDNYILHNLDNFNEIAEKRPMNNEIGKRRDMGKYEGAFVFTPTPGLYENIVFFDFTSMYASVMITYNLSKATFIEGDKFEKKEGFFPKMLQDIIEKRKKHKKELAKNPSGMLKARSNAYKLLANAAYGYQGFFGARYYCREAAAATARLAKENILSTIEKIKKEGYKIIYSDTDSIAFLQEKKTDKQVLTFLEKINKELPGIMELDLEDFYKRGIFVFNRGGTSGAKKKYALLDRKDKMKIRGFETVRRDWCDLARRLQSEILTKILKEGNGESSLKLLKKTIIDLKGRKIDLEDLMIKTQLKKPIKEYQSKGPHVIAAEKMLAAGEKIDSGMMIYYFIGESSTKGKRVGDKVFLPGEKAEYNINYYLDKQILPAVENIFEVFDLNVKEILDGESQKKLF